MNQYQEGFLQSILFFIGIVKVGVKKCYFLRPKMPPFFLFEKAGLVLFLEN